MSPQGINLGPNLSKSLPKYSLGLYRRGPGVSPHRDVHSSSLTVLQVRYMQYYDMIPCGTYVHLKLASNRTYDCFAIIYLGVYTHRLTLQWTPNPESSHILTTLVTCTQSAHLRLLPQPTVFPRCDATIPFHVRPSILTPTVWANELLPPDICFSSHDVGEKVQYLFPQR